MGENEGYKQLRRMIRGCVATSITCAAVAAVLAITDDASRMHLISLAILITLQIWLVGLAVGSAVTAANAYLTRARDYTAVRAFELGMSATDAIDTLISDPTAEAPHRACHGAGTAALTVPGRSPGHQQSA